MDHNFDNIKCILDGAIDSQLDFITSNSDYTGQITKLGKDYNIISNINFNIFTSLSDYYYRENLHSDILRFIFDPQTERIGNKKFIKILIEFIEKELNKKIILDLDTIIIERETNRIDILIYDSNKNCIFIENKINNAVDRENQIGKYYEKLIQKKYNINAIVYLTLSPLKKLDRDYSIKNNEKRKEIENILIEIPVVNKKGQSNFIDGVINKCIKKSKNMFSIVYLTEYSNLLKYLGGNFMADDLNTQVMQKIFADNNILQSFRIFGNLWDNRQRIIGNVFKEYFQHELNFLVHSGDPINTVYTSIKEDINIGFCNDCSFGFVHYPGSEKIKSPNIGIFRELLEDVRLKKYFTEDKAIENGWWVYNMLDYNKISCLNELKILKEELEKIINEKL